MHWGLYWRCCLQLVTLLFLSWTTLPSSADWLFFFALCHTFLFTLCYMFLFALCYMFLFTLSYMFLFTLCYMFLFTLCYMFLFTLCYMFLFTLCYMFLFALCYMFLFTLCYMFLFALCYMFLFALCYMFLFALCYMFLFTLCYMFLFTLCYMFLFTLCHTFLLRFNTVPQGAWGECSYISTLSNSRYFVMRIVSIYMSVGQIASLDEQEDVSFGENRMLLACQRVCVLLTLEMSSNGHEYVFTLKLAWNSGGNCVHACTEVPTTALHDVTVQRNIIFIPKPKFQFFFTFIFLCKWLFRIIWFWLIRVAIKL